MIRFSLTTQSKKQRMVLSMNNSIQQFLHLGKEEIEKNMRNFMSDGFDLTKLERVIHEQVLILGKNIIKEMIEQIDTDLKESETRKKNWIVERNNEPKSLLTSLGWMTYHRTLFTSKQTKKSVYLVDELIRESTHGKMTLGAASNLLEEATESSYQKGGKKASCLDGVSKQTVKNLIHNLSMEQPKLEEKPVKKRMKTLHIVADEDHVALQFQMKKGDLTKGETGFKNNTSMPKIICVYEDIVDDGSAKSKRHRLTGKRYFGGLYKGEKNQDLWAEVAEYIETHYDTDYLERVYLAGDGAAWIKAGCEWIGKSRFVLDKYHLSKYIRKATVHLLDSQEEVREELYSALLDRDKGEVKSIFNRILNVTEEGYKEIEVRESLRYILNHWMGITIYSEDGGAVWGCCAEGQVSHVYASRMSSRPMGWSPKGVDQMSKLRIYQANGGKVIDLLTYQKKKELKENRIKKEEEMIREIQKKATGRKYAEQMWGEVPGLSSSSFKWMKGFINNGLCI